jgi:hypothetical protein
MCISLLKTKHFGMMVCLGYCAYRACKKVAETYEDVDASEEREKKRAEEHARVVAEQEPAAHTERTSLRENLEIMRK